MKIKYFGHSSFLFDFDGIRVVTDPFNSYVGYDMPTVSADIITCSHFHEDHHDLSMIKRDFVLLDTQCKYSRGDLWISSFSTFHDNAKGAQRGKNLVFQFDFKGIGLVHMGDFGEDVNALTFSLKDVDFLFIPVGGVYTIDAQTAYECAANLNPRFVVPMHYKLDETRFGLARVTDFIKHYSDSDILYVKNIDTDNVLNSIGKKVIVFE